MSNSFNKVLVSLFLLLFLSCSVESDIDDKGWEKTYAMVYHIYVGKGGSTRNEYFVDDKRYEFSGRYTASRVILGEKFIIKYNPDNPKKIKAYVWLPIFLSSYEETKETVGEVTRIFWINRKSYALGFKYEVDGVKYKRSQHLPPNYKEVLPELEKGQSYKVIYDASFPQRAILIFDDNFDENDEIYAPFNWTFLKNEVLK